MTRVFAAVCGVCLWLVVGLLASASIERNVLGTSYMFHGDEVVGYLMATLFMLALPVALIDGGHVRINSLYRNLPGTLRRILRPVFRMLGLTAGLLLTAGGIGLVVNSMSTGRMSYGVIELPVWIPQLVIAVGGAVFAVAFLALRDDMLDEPHDAIEVEPVERQR